MDAATTVRSFSLGASWLHETLTLGGLCFGWHPGYRRENPGPPADHIDRQIALVCRSVVVVVVVVSVAKSC